MHAHLESRRNRDLCRSVSPPAFHPLVKSYLRAITRSFDLSQNLPGLIEAGDIVAVLVNPGAYWPTNWSAAIAVAYALLRRPSILGVGTDTLTRLQNAV
jgi:hypothetical protein